MAAPESEKGKLHAGQPLTRRIKTDCFITTSFNQLRLRKDDGL